MLDTPGLIDIISLDQIHTLSCPASRWARKWWWCVLRYTFRRCDRARLDMHLGAVIKWIWRCFWRLRLSMLRNSLGGRNCASLEAVIERLWRCSWRPRLGEDRDTLRGHDQARLEQYSKAVNLEAVCSGGRRDGSGDSIHWLSYNSANVENWVQHGLVRDETGSKREIVDLGMMQNAVYTVLSECCTRCMWYLVYAVLGVCCTRCMLYSVCAVLGVCCTGC
jgi:hypothetical protein